MTSKTFTRLAGASLIVTTTMVGCSGAQMGQRPAIASNQATDIAGGIERALTAHDFARAQLDAERLVEAQPREAASRTLLGRAYLANGRYASARTAFEDAIALGATDARTIVSLALVRTAMGSPEGARALLSANIDHLPASDYGLAMAMAGDAQEGVRALMEAVRLPEADVQTRQNLAYALALGGEWGQARLVAGQDLAGSQLQNRIAQWAASAQVEAYPQRVAALIGVAPRADDAGLPARLALSNSEPTSLAAAQPLEPSAMAAQAARDSAPVPVQTPAVMADAAPVPNDAAPTTTVAETAFASAPDAAPLIHASTDPMREAVMKRLADPAPVTRAPTGYAFAKPSRGLTVATSTASADNRHGGSDWVVQIGAFRDVASATAGWKRAHGQTFAQRGYHKVTGTVTVGGKTYQRLAMSGFADRTTAVSLCASLRAQGQTCFVRRDAGVANDIRMARAGKPAKVAVIAKAQKIALR